MLSFSSSSNYSSPFCHPSGPQKEEEKSNTNLGFLGGAFNEKSKSKLFNSLTCSFSSKLSSKKWMVKGGVGVLGFIALSCLYQNRDSLLKSYREFLEYQVELKRRGLEDDG